MNNIVIIDKKELKNYSIVIPAKNEIYKENDFILIEELKTKVKLAKITKATDLVRKGLEVSDKITCYRKK